MGKLKWFEVYGLIDDDDSGTETKESFDTLKEAQNYIEQHKNEELSIDEWEMNEDGTDVAKIQSIC